MVITCTENFSLMNRKSQCFRSKICWIFSCFYRWQMDGCSHIHEQARLPQMCNRNTDAMSRRLAASAGTGPPWAQVNLLVERPCLPRACRNHHTARASWPMLAIVLLLRGPPLLCWASSLRRPSWCHCCGVEGWLDHICWRWQGLKRMAVELSMLLLITEKLLFSPLSMINNLWGNTLRP